MPKSKGKGKVEPLDRIPIDIQEALILEDLLYVLMVNLAIFWDKEETEAHVQGIEGTYITHHPDYSQEDDDPLDGIKFAVSPNLGAPLGPLVIQGISLIARRPIFTRLGRAHPTAWDILHCN